MTPRKPATHLSLLAAAVASWTVVTAVLLAATIRVDGPDAGRWVPVLGAVLAVWVFALAWMLAAFVLATVAAVRALRSHRPAPGTGRRNTAPPLAEVIGWETARRNCILADAWAAEQPEEFLVDEFEQAAHEAARAAA